MQLSHPETVSGDQSAQLSRFAVDRRRAGNEASLGSPPLKRNGGDWLGQVRAALCNRHRLRTLGLVASWSNPVQAQTAAEDLKASGDKIAEST
jgi:hypothetical protein